MKIRACSLLIIPLLFVASCATLDKDSSYLLKSLDDANKSIALTNQGIIAYENYLLGQGDYNKADEVREYFVVALRYDPSNPRAAQYVDKVDNFRTALVRDKLTAANKLLAKPKRTDDDNYAMIAALQTAVAIDPSNDSASKLLKDNSSVQSSLVVAFLSRSKDAQAKAADPKTAASAREGLYLQAYDSASKAYAIAPANAQASASKQKAAVQAELAKAFSAHVANTTKLVSAAKFDDAKAELGRAVAIDQRLGHPNSDALDGATYSLYFSWAKSLDAKASYQEAEPKIDLALAAKKSDEAIALKKKLDGKTVSVNQDASFEAALPEIDKSIDRGDLLGANKRILAVVKTTKDRAKLDQLDSRKAKITAALSDIYGKGVAAYKAEDFKTAIDQLTQVVGIDSEYEQASDYLSKAKEKQKLLDQYSN
jgi:hypothetical protein